MTLATAAHVRLAYDDLGQGEPALLFLPGWCVARSAFSTLSSLCARSRRVLALDWRGHGESDPSGADFGEEGLVEDALTVVEASGARAVVPVALSQAGWVAVELRRRLGERVAKLVAVDWLVTEASQAFLETLAGMQSQQTWRATVERLLARWTQGVEDPRLARFVREEVGAFGFDMWARAAREVMADYNQFGSPLRALAELDPPLPALHLFAQPDDPAYLAAQREFAARHPWFRVEKLPARTHFPMFEVPDLMAEAIERFARG